MGLTVWPKDKAALLVEYLYKYYLAHPDKLPVFTGRSHRKKACPRGG